MEDATLLESPNSHHSGGMKRKNKILVITWRDLQRGIRLVNLTIGESDHKDAIFYCMNSFNCLAA